MTGVRLYPRTLVSGVDTSDTDDLIRASMPLAVRRFHIAVALTGAKASSDCAVSNIEVIRQGRRGGPAFSVAIGIRPQGAKNSEIAPGQPVVEDSGGRDNGQALGHLNAPPLSSVHSKIAIATASLSSAGSKSRARTAAMISLLGALPLPAMYRLMVPTGTPW